MPRHVARIGAGLFTAALLFSFAACGDEAEDEPSTTTVTSTATTLASTAPATSTPSETATGTGGEGDLATSLLVTADDFPAGWDEFDYEESALLEQCDLGGDARLARAATGMFVGSSGETGYRNTVVILDDASAALAEVEDLDQWTECMTAAIRGGGFDSEDARVVDVSSAPLDLPDVGATSVAFRINVTVETTAGEAREVAVDMAAFAQGRFASQVVALHFVSPGGTDMLVELAEASEAKLAAAP